MVSGHALMLAFIPACMLQDQRKVSLYHDLRPVLKQAYSTAWSPADVTINTESAPAQTAHLAAHG